MSSGLKGNTGISAQAYVGTDSFRSWSGADGKYDSTPAGKARSRWNPYTVTSGYRRRTSNQWTCTRVDGVVFTTTANASFLQGKFSPPIPSSLELQAQSKLAAKIKGHSFNLAVNAAQSKQLVDMVVSNLGKLGRGILALKHGDFATAARALGAQPRISRLKPSDISGRWLELQYGWLPTLSDIFEAAKAYEKLTSKERSTTFRASASQDVDVECAGSPSFSTCIMKVKQKVSIRAELTEQLSAARTLGLQDPLSLVWEILPYSFVVDWFIPIGTYLETLNVLPSLTGRFATTKSNVYTGMTPALKYTAPLPGNFGGFFCKSVVYEGTDQIRGVYSDRVITSGLSATLPSFDSGGLHGKRIWNAIALAYQRFH